MPQSWNAELLAPIVQKARDYTLGLLADVNVEDWFRIPAGLTSHLAWQVGHLTVSQYRLAVARVRGERPDDARVLPPEFVHWFGKGSVPQPAGGGLPTVARLQEVRDAVHRLTMSEITAYSPALLIEPVDTPHPMFVTKAEAIQWCAMHEMLHAGHIAALRRALGYPSLR